MSSEVARLPDAANHAEAARHWIANVIDTDRDNDGKFCCCFTAGNALEEARHIPRQELLYNVISRIFFGSDLIANTTARRTYADIMSTADLRRLQLCNTYRSVSEIDDFFDRHLGGVNCISTSVCRYGGDADRHMVKLRDERTARPLGSRGRAGRKLRFSSYWETLPPASCPMPCHSLQNFQPPQIQYRLPTDGTR